MSMSHTKLISQCFVRPEIEVHKNKRLYPLNPFDLRLLLVEDAQLGFLFAKPVSFSPSSYLERLRFSLSQALVHFYPLAGRLVTVRNEADHSSCIYVDCAKGPGARLIYASATDLSVVEVVRPNNSDVVVLSLFDLGEIGINYDGHTRPLLSVQVTELKDGVFLGISFNHSVVDGISVFHFQRVWSHFFMGTISSSISSMPLVKQPDFFHGRVFKLPYLDPSEFVIRSTVKYDLTGTYFQFSHQSLKDLKAIANSESKSKKAISTFLALIAFVWRCITRVRSLPSDELTTCAVPINLRPRFNPPLSDDYFGNYAVKARWSPKVGDLLSNNIGWAATHLQQVVAAHDEKVAHAYVSRALEEGPEIVKPFQPSRSSNVMVGASPLFNLNESNFGLGRLLAFRSGCRNKMDGKVEVYMGTKGDGSVEVDIRLKPDTMNALLSDQEFMCFASLDTSHLNLTSRI